MMARKWSIPVSVIPSFQCVWCARLVLRADQPLGACPGCGYDGTDAKLAELTATKVQWTVTKWEWFDAWLGRMLANPHLKGDTRRRLEAWLGESDG